MDLLETTKKKDIRKLQVMGDSKLVIDWAKGKFSFQNINLGQYFGRHKTLFSIL
jgi:hypothetical protein